MHLHFSTTMSHPIRFIASVFRINELVHSLQSMKQSFSRPRYFIYVRLDEDRLDDHEHDPRSFGVLTNCSVST